MSDSLSIQPVGQPIEAKHRPPGSKSLTNRAYIVAAMATGSSRLSGVLDSDDTVVMRDALGKLGVKVDFQAADAVATVDGNGSFFTNKTAELFVKNSGTSIRFLTAMLAFAGGRYRLDGIERMRERPIGPLVDALNGLGSHVVAESPNRCPPVVIDAAKISGGKVSLSGNLSSQYLSGLLMGAGFASQDVELQIEGELISQPYVEMTCRVMESFGVSVQRDFATQRFVVPGGQAYQPTEYWIEPDASAASYFWAAAAILGGRATVIGLNRNSLQGDVGFVDCLGKMGCQVECQDDSITVVGPAKHGATLDMAHVSDTVQTLAAVALFVDGPTSVNNIAHNRVKETDRIGNLAIELRKFGARVDEREDGFTIHPAPLRGAVIDTYDDHRMAMSLALVGLKQRGVVINDPGCVSKTYPNYFEDLASFVSK